MPISPQTHIQLRGAHCAWAAILLFTEVALPKSSASANFATGAYSVGIAFCFTASFVVYYTLVCLSSLFSEKTEKEQTEKSALSDYQPSNLSAIAQKFSNDFI